MRIGRVFYLLGRVLAVIGATMAVPLLVSDTALFEDIFYNGSQFLVMPKPQDWDGAKIYAERPFETEIGRAHV